LKKGLPLKEGGHLARLKKGSDSRLCGERALKGGGAFGEENEYFPTEENGSGVYRRETPFVGGEIH